MKHPAFDRAFDLEAAGGEHLEHAVVFPQDIGFELGNPVRAGDIRKMLQEQGSQATVLVGIRHGKRHLGAGRWDIAGRADVAARCNNMLLVFFPPGGDEPDVVDEIQFSIVP
jgi:hypothetical protein